MKIIQLSARLSIILGLVCITIIDNQIFTEIKPAFSKNHHKNHNKIKFSLPAPPPGKPLIGRTRGGGRRGPCPEVETTLTAIVPFTQKTLKIGNIEKKRQSVWGLTTQFHPQFPFYVPFNDKHSLPTEFLLKDEETKKIVYQSEVNLPSKPGVIHVALPKTVKPLEENKNYRWYFNIYCETKKTIPSLRVEGVVRRVKLNQELTQKIHLAKPAEQVKLYAAEGIWFNSINTLAQLRQREPENKELIENWQNLVESIDMEDIANKPLVSNNK